MRKYTSIALLITVAFVFACNSSSKEDLVVGTWKFDEKDNGGKKVTFNKDKTCYSTTIDDGKVDTIAKFKYSFANGGKQLITVDPTGDRKTDTVEVVELSSTVLKIKTPAGDTVVLKKN